MLKNILRKGLNVFGVQMAFTKNLWYNDGYLTQYKLIQDRENPVIFDVGACEGSVVKAYRSKYPHARIHAFEPQPEPFKILQDQSPGGDIHFNNLALGEKPGMAQFYKTTSHASSSLLEAHKSGSFVDTHTVLDSTFEVQVETLDSYCDKHNVDHIDVLKMDVQGYELNVLKGAQQLLAQKKIDIIYSEVWFTEAYKGQALYEDIALFLRGFGHKLFGLYDIHRDMNLHGKALWGDAIFIRDTITL